MTTRLRRATVAAVTFAALAAAGSSSVPAADALCIDRIVGTGRIYEPVLSVTAGSVSPGPLTTFLRPRCDDTPVAGVTAPRDDVGDPAPVHGVRGVRLQLAAAVPMRVGKRLVYRLYVRPGVCRSTVDRGTGRFLACLRAYNRATTPRP